MRRVRSRLGRGRGMRRRQQLLPRSSKPSRIGGVSWFGALEGARRSGHGVMIALIGSGWEVCPAMAEIQGGWRGLVLNPPLTEKPSELEVEGRVWAYHMGRWSLSQEFRWLCCDSWIAAMYGKVYSWRETVLNKLTISLALRKINKF